MTMDKRFALLVLVLAELALRVSLLSAWLADKDSTLPDRLAQIAQKIVPPVPLLVALNALMISL